MRKSAVRAIPFLLIIVMIAVAVIPASAGPRFTEKAIPLGIHKSDEQVFAGSVQLSDDRQHITYVSKNHDGKVRVWIDGITGVSYEGASTPRFVPGTDKVAYIAADNGKMFTIINGKKGPEHARADGLTFSPDGSRFGYRAQNNDGKVFAVVDGKPGPLFVNVLPDPGILFSPDGRHAIYTGVNEAGSQVLVKNHEPVRAFDEIKEVTFSPDSRPLAYAGRSGQDWSVIHNDTENDPYDNINGILFSSDSNHLAYMAEKGKRVVVIKDGKEQFSGETAGVPFFSPDGTRFGFLMKKGKGWHLMMDGKKGPLIARPDKVVFSEDSRHFAYSALIDTTWAVIKDSEIVDKSLQRIRFLTFLPDSPSLLYIAVPQTGKEYMMVNGQKYSSFDSIGLPVFPHGQDTIAHVAQDGKDMFFVVGEKKEGHYRTIGIPRTQADGSVAMTSQFPFFSPDGARVAYPAIDHDNRVFMVVDGKSHEYYEAITEPVFSPDGRHMAYTAQKNGKWLAVVDGIEGEKRFDGILKDSHILFDTPSSFFVLAINLPGPSFYKLAVTIESEAILDSRCEGDCFVAFAPRNDVKTLCFRQ